MDPIEKLHVTCKMFSSFLVQQNASFPLTQSVNVQLRIPSVVSYLDINLQNFIAFVSEHVQKL